MNSTSLQAYRQKAIKIGSRRFSVFNIIEQCGPISNRDILEKLKALKPWEHWEINMVTGRTSELVDEGVVEEAGTTIDTRSNCTVRVWRVAQDEKQVVMFV